MVYDMSILPGNATQLPSKFPLTITEWILHQARGDGLDRLLQLQASLKTSDVAWISIASPEQLKRQWENLQDLKSQGHLLPLYGVPFAAKDNIDVEDFMTTAACPDFAYLPLEDAGVIRELKRAGAVVMGKTNLDQFATGLVGTRSPYGAVPNTFNKEYVSGGSSSGSASVVARGLVPFSLGTDTAGSGRVPAGLNNLVGLKPTRGFLSARGVVPACRSLDCVSIFALTIEDARLVLTNAGVYDEKDSYSRAMPTTKYQSIGITPRIAICENPLWFGNTKQQLAYEEGLEKCTELGWQLIPSDFSLLFKLADLLYDGPWVAERYAAIRSFISRKDIVMDPTVSVIIKKAHQFTSVDVFESEYLRQDLTRAIETYFSSFDALLVPTTPTFPTLQQLKDQPILENSRLGTYTNFVNFLDWSAIAFPAGFRSDGLPFGLTLISTAWEEKKLLDLSSSFLTSTTSRTLGSTGNINMAENHSGQISIAAVGAHLSGLPLNYQLKDIGAELLQKTTTSKIYRLYKLKPHPDVPVSRPALKRVVAGCKSGFAIDLEVWTMPAQELSKFCRSVAAPLFIGPIELAGGSVVNGFVCDTVNSSTIEYDISHFGGWRNFMSGFSAENDSSASAKSTRSTTFSKVLIANRGEIAVRIAKTLKKLGVHSVAIYSKEDRTSQHVAVADSSFALDGNTITETYLNQSQITTIAKSCGAEAIIPGYGFLSENAEFAEACEDDGIIWVGPTPQQMRNLGLKHIARALAENAAVPLLPGTKILRGVEHALSEADRIGYPLMIKSTAGGGGIGLQKCTCSEDLKAAFSTVQHQGKTYFKDDGIFLEHFVDNAKHIEIQIIGDGEGVVRHIGARDCSLQRRHQKVVEECPAALVPEEIYYEMCQSAIRLAESIKYRNVGTVEFIYDAKSSRFYFLEVNTRLQVEHPVTEEVFGYDLVEEMLRISSGAVSSLFSADLRMPHGHALEVRIYAEAPLRDFQPSSGQVLDLSFPNNVRIDTWLVPGQVVSSSFDPLIAKLIIVGSDRVDAVFKLQEALEKTTINGIDTNLEYLKQVVAHNSYISGDYNTTSLGDFEFKPHVIEVITAGSSTTIQDYPGRVGKWHIGIPPSGPMDDYSFQIANRILGNEPDAAALECTSTGPTLLFHCATTIVVVGPPYSAGRDSPRVEQIHTQGASTELRLDGQMIPLSTPININPGQILAMSAPKFGLRSYIAVKGGLQTPVIFGSRSTFALGKFGGFNGRELRKGDILPIADTSTSVPLTQTLYPPISHDYSKPWTLRVMAGPHAFPDYFEMESYKSLFEKPWKVHYNSNRVGVRLVGPKPVWARKDGGDAGLHPSNIHDSPYSLGSISYTGDEAVILTRDGPSLGGFVVFAVIVASEMWKIGQMRPGDQVYLCPITSEQAEARNEDLRRSIENLCPLSEDSCAPAIVDPIIENIERFGRHIKCRQAGDSALLLEFGEDKFDIRSTLHIHALMKKVAEGSFPCIVELTPGSRSLHVTYDSLSPQRHALDVLIGIESSIGPDLPSILPSRTLSLPIVLEHSSVIEAVERYRQTIRSEAPWLPNNVDFLQKVNGLSNRNEIFDTILSATYLVIGLGDVFCGSPCTIPLDPRHRLIGTKYNPSRSFTAEGTVGLAGQYLCIYGVDSPGGYQLVGRTVPIWDLWAARKNPWMFEMLDQIKFYVISEEELNESREAGTCDQLVKIEQGSLDFSKYEALVAETFNEASSLTRRRMDNLKKTGMLDELIKSYASQASEEYKTETSDPEPGELVVANIAGKCWKCSVSVGDMVEEGQEIICLEAMKMEIRIGAPIRGRITKVYVKTGDTLDVDNRIASIMPE
ncbi:urea carboxylase [Phlyctema vagabunda]|uniref:Urea carboxylase n=1 Tax=Phlyctema vagabunda TaxID=108571 RepID=A0ABR4PMF5_9HELO